MSSVGAVALAAYGLAVVWLIPKYHGVLIWELTAISAFVAGLALAGWLALESNRKGALKTTRPAAQWAATRIAVSVLSNLVAMLTGGVLMRAGINPGWSIASQALAGFVGAMLLSLPGLAARGLASRQRALHAVSFLIGFASLLVGISIDERSAIEPDIAAWLIATPLVIGLANPVTRKWATTDLGDLERRLGRVPTNTETLSRSLILVAIQGAGSAAFYAPLGFLMSLARPDPAAMQAVSGTAIGGTMVVATLYVIYSLAQRAGALVGHPATNSVIAGVTTVAAGFAFAAVAFNAAVSAAQAGFVVVLMILLIISAAVRR
jgi:hypothetical protein